MMIIKTAKLNKYFNQRYHGIRLPYESLPGTPEAITSKIMERVSSASALLLQPSFICDLLIISDTDQTAQYYPEINVEYVLNNDLSQNDQYYMIALEYGEFPEGDPLCIGRDPDPDLSHKDVYVHPIIRRYKQAELLREHHIPKVLENDWEIFQFLRQVDGMRGEDIRSMYTDRINKFFYDEIGNQ